MSRFVDSIIAYRILQMLVTPFDKTDAFRLGIIDKNGKELKPMTQLNTVQEKDAYSILHRLVYIYTNLCRIEYASFSWTVFN